jgi:hypothetical protein
MPTSTRGEASEVRIMNGPPCWFAGSSRHRNRASWSWPHLPFPDPGDGEVQVGPLLVCETCHADMLAGKWQSVVDRSVREFPRRLGGGRVNKQAYRWYVEQYVFAFRVMRVNQGPPGRLFERAVPFGRSVVE